MADMWVRDQLFIDGKWHAPEGGDVITVVSPHSEAIIGHAACAGPEDVNRAVEAARAAFDTGPWPRMQAGERIEALTRLAGIYKERRADMAARIESYRRGAVPLSVPIAILAHYASDGELPWLAGQTYLEPYPDELRLRHNLPR